MNLKELEKFLKLCRKQGVQSIRYEDIEVHLHEHFQPTVIKAKGTKPASTITYAPGGVTDSTKIVTDEITPEQLLFGSSDPSVWNTDQ